MTLWLHVFVFLLAGSILLAAQSALVVRAVNAARSSTGDAGQTRDAVWTALPGFLLLALLAYSLFHLPG